MSLLRKLFPAKENNQSILPDKLNTFDGEIIPDLDKFTLKATEAEIGSIKDYLLNFEDQSLFVFGDDFIQIKNDFIYDKDEFGDNICSLYNLGLPSIDENLFAEIEDKSIIHTPNYQIQIMVKSRKNNKSGDITGAFYNYAGKISVVPEVIYRVNKEIIHHNKSAKTPDDNWCVIANIKHIAKNNIRQIFFRDNTFLKKQEPIIIDTLAINSKINENGNIFVSPIFPQSHHSDELNRSINQHDTVLSQHEVNGQKYILSQKVIVATQQIKEKSIIKDKLEKYSFIEDPRNIYDKLVDVADLSLFSERVVGYGINEESVKININNESNWNYPFPLDFFDNNNDLVFNTFETKEQANDFIQMVSERFNSKDGYFQINSSIIPFNSSNIQVLKKIMDFSISSPEDDIGKSNLKEVILLNTSNLEFKVNKSKLKSIAREIDDFIKEQDNHNFDLVFNVSSGYLIESTHDQEMQLNKHNLMIIFKNIRRGLIVQEIEYSSLVEKIINEECFSAQAHLPPTLKVTLKEHQNQGVLWLQNCYMLNRKDLYYNGVLLADDMGLGKTLQVLTFLEGLFFYEKINKPHLVVAPVILLNNWQDEYRKFFSGDNDPFILDSNSVKQFLLNKTIKNDQLGLSWGKEKIPISLDIKSLSQKQIIIVNYDTLVRYQTSLAAIDWHTVVLDEAQNIKTPGTQKSKVTKILKAEFKIAMTGTPVENSMLDVWSIFDFLNEGLLSPLQQFKSEYTRDKISNESISKLKHQLYFGKQYSYMLRRLKKDVLSGFVSKEIKTYKVDYNVNQLSRYKELMHEWIKYPKNALVLLPQINKLHQALVLLDGDVGSFYESAKARKLIEIIKDIKASGDKVLIFAILIDMQNYLKDLIDSTFKVSVNILNGNTSPSERKLFLSQFEQDPEQFVMILSPKAAGVGLNIVAANHVIHYGRWWNPAIESQATDRVYRIGQEKPVYVHYLIHHDSKNQIKSFDEKFHDLLIAKMNLADDFLNVQQSDLSKDLIESLGE